MSESAIKSQIQDDMKAAMRAKHTARLAAIRLIMAAAKQKEVDEQIQLSDEQMLALLDKMVKQRRDAKAQYEKANRQDLADKEALEIDVISQYLPEALSDEDIDAIIKAAMAESGASSMQDMGKLMGLIKPQLQGRADMGAVSKKIKALLS